MNDRLKSLYQSVILKHQKKPYHYSSDELSNYNVISNNPLCGDKYSFKIEQDEQRIRSIYFHGYGCAISKASNSILAQSLENLTVTKAKDLCHQFLSFVETGNLDSDDIPEEFEAFTAVKSFPGRKDCACLGWEEVQKYLLNLLEQLDQ